MLLPFIFGKQAGAENVAQNYQMNRFRIAGFQYYSGPQLRHQLSPGAPLQLIAEPKNRHDPFAVRIEWRGNKLGYVPRSDNHHISRLLLQGVKLQAQVIKSSKDSDQWQGVRVAVGVEVG